MLSSPAVLEPPKNNVRGNCFAAAIGSRKYNVEKHALIRFVSDLYSISYVNKDLHQSESLGIRSENLPYNSCSAILSHKPRMMLSETKVELSE